MFVFGSRCRNVVPAPNVAVVLVQQPSSQTLSPRVLCAVNGKPKSEREKIPACHIYVA